MSRAESEARRGRLSKAQSGALPPTRRPSAPPGRGPAGGMTPERLLAAMTLDEKIGQLHMVSADAVITGPAGPPDGLRDLDQGRIGAVLNLWGEAARALQHKAVSDTRLGVPLLFCLDVIHGHCTVFPIPLGEAAAFDEDLWLKTAAAAARETAEDGVALTFAPMVDVARDPRWGRISESAGEDPLVNARMARAKVAGFQGDDLSDPTRVAATVKHFAAYGAGEGGREYDSVDVSEHALAADYLPPFHAAVTAQVAALMPAFPAVSGVPMHANAPMLQGLLRERWGFGGVTIADYNGVAELIAHGAAEDGAAAAALAFNAGVDIDMVSGLYLRHLGQAVEEGLVSRAALDAAVLRVLRLKQQLGLFDDPYRQCPPSPPELREARRDLARQAARAALTLLRDPQDLLPLPPDLRRIAVLGDLAASAVDMHGAWAGSGDVEATVTILDGVRAAWPQAGVAWCGDDALAAADALAGADVAIVCIGERASQSGEAAARANPVLSQQHQALVNAALEAGVPVMALLASGRPLVAPHLFAAPCAVLAIWGAGQAAGAAIADVLSGAVSPSGRTPVSWPRAVGQIPVHYARHTTGRPHEDGNRYSVGYADLPLSPQFPFGHGLSYARFRWSDLSVSPVDAANPAAPLRISLTVQHDGARRGGARSGSARPGALPATAAPRDAGWDGAATETVFLFVRARSPGRSRPDILLRDFARLTLAPGATGEVVFETSLAQLAAEGLAPPRPIAFLEILVMACAEPAARFNDGRCLRQVLIGAAPAPTGGSGAAA